MNKITMLVALHALGHTDVMKRELDRLLAFTPIQEGLRALIAGYDQHGLDIFRQLGYWWRRRNYAGCWCLQCCCWFTFGRPCMEIKVAAGFGLPLVNLGWISRFMLVYTFGRPWMDFKVVSGIKKLALFFF